MKCEGATNPPCARCRKAGRECQLFPQQNAYEYSGLSSPYCERHLLPGAMSGIPTWSGHPLPHTPASSVSLNRQPTSSNDYVSSRNIDFPERFTEPHVQTLGPASVTQQTASPARSSTRKGIAVSDLPSIFWTSPTDAVNDPRHQKVGLEPFQTQTKRKRSEGQSRSPEVLWSLSDNAILQQPDEEVKISKQDLRDMMLM
jgi:hypothetical protein